MRAFVAVDLTAPTREAASRFVEDLRRQPVFDDVKVSWVRTANLHVTLQFLGDIEAETADRLIGALDAPWSLAPFEVVFDRCDAFPPRGAPRAIYLAVTAGADRLVALHAEVAGRINACGVVPESRPFRPHMTIGRVRHAVPRIARRIRAVVESATVDVPASAIDQVVLYESRLLAAGPRYEPLLRVPIDAGP